MVDVKKLLPDFRRNSTKLQALLGAQLFTLLVSSMTFSKDFFLHYGLVSMYLLWVLLLTILGILALRKFLTGPQKALTVSLYCLFVFTLSFGMTETAAQLLFPQDNYLGFDFQRFFRYLVVTLICSLVIIRGFFLKNLFEERVRSESEMRLKVLQSRIRPHFLFNTLNSIAELAHSSPNDAEQAIESLSMLFRASLENQKGRHSIESELRLCQRYLDLEKFRLGEKLNYEVVNHAAEMNRWQCPKLLLQPIIENAVTHGRDENGVVELKVDIRETASHLSFKVVNRLGVAKANEAGNGIAIESIRETMFVLYDDNYAFNAREHDGCYEVIMRIPKQENMEEVHL